MPNPDFAVQTHLPVVMALEESATEGLVPEWGEASRLAALLRVHAAMVKEIVPGGYASRVGRAERLIAGYAVTTIAGSASLRADRVR
ncbi:MAG TPA: hypothetical protein VLN59_15535 [Burkholderiales bacterium]|nr:hypothetical protein [Burkholderiales bacterium]